MSWQVSEYATCSADPYTGKYPYYDDGRLAYRIQHVESLLVGPIPFQRFADCNRAVLLMNNELPINTAIDGKDIVRAIKEKYGSLQNWRHRIISLCCQW